MYVQFLTTFPTLKACNSPYMQDYFRRCFVLFSSEVIFLFLIKKVNTKSTINNNCIFLFLWESLGSHVGLLIRAKPRMLVFQNFPIWLNRGVGYGFGSRLAPSSDNLALTHSGNQQRRAIMNFDFLSLPYWFKPRKI